MAEDIMTWANEIETHEPETPEPEPEVKPGEEAAAQTPEETAAPESETPETETKDPEHIPYSRFKEVYGKAKQAEREADYWRNEAMRQDRAKPHKQDQEQKDPQTEFSKPKPKMDDFEDETEFYEALTDWKMEHRDFERQNQAYQSEQQQKVQEFQNRLAKGAEKYSDWNNVIANPDVPVSQAMFEVMSASEHTPDLAYYLGKHPEEAKRIAQMSPLGAAKEMGRIEYQIANAQTTPKKTNNNPPEPTKPVSGNEPAPTKAEEDMTMDEWYAAFRGGKL